MKQLLEQALHALHDAATKDEKKAVLYAYGVIQQVLDDWHDEPVGYLSPSAKGWVRISHEPISNEPNGGVSIYTHPAPKRQLTNDEITELSKNDDFYLDFGNGDLMFRPVEFVRAIEKLIL